MAQKEIIKEGNVVDIITQRFKLKDIFPDKCKALCKEYDLKAEEAEYIIKGITPSDLKVEEEEHAIISYITTNSVDRDREIIDPKGLNAKEYLKNAVVLWGHDYHSRALPLGRNLWLKSDEKGIIAKTQYYIKDEFAKKVYEYRKDGFPLAESIGFIPLAWRDIQGEESTKLGGARRIYTKVLLLEYSDVVIPSNPDAVGIARAKGLIAEAGTETKIEETENMIHIPAKGQEGKHSGHRIRTIDIDKDKGVKARYCGECKVVISWLFSKKEPYNWTLAKAKKWVKDHEKQATIDVIKMAEENPYLPEDYKKELEGDNMADDKGKDKKKEIKEEENKPNKTFSANEIYKIIKESIELKEDNILLKQENEELLEKMKELEIKAGAVLNKKNKDKLNRIKTLADEALESAAKEQATEPSGEEAGEKATYDCECIKCGRKTKTEKHCKDIVCSECGGEMRREERPGARKEIEIDLSEIDFKQIVIDTIKEGVNAKEIKKSVDDKIDLLKGIVI